MSAQPKVNETLTPSHVIGQVPAFGNGKQGHTMPPRREPLPLKTPESKSLSITPIVAVVVSILVFLAGIIGGIIGSVSTNYYWKGTIETRVVTLENQRLEDQARRQADQTRIDSTLEYIRTQNEVNGKDLSGMKAILEEWQRSNRR